MVTPGRRTAVRCIMIASTAFSSVMTTD